MSKTVSAFFLVGLSVSASSTRGQTGESSAVAGPPTAWLYSPTGGAADPITLPESSRGAAARVPTPPPLIVVALPTAPRPVSQLPAPQKIRITAIGLRPTVSAKTITLLPPPGSAPAIAHGPAANTAAAAITPSKVIAHPVAATPARGLPARPLVLGVILEDPRVRAAFTGRPAPAAAVVIASVVPGSTADLGGLTSGDGLTRLGGRRTSNPAELVNALHTIRPGDLVPVTIVRSGATLALQLQF